MHLIFNYLKTVSLVGLTHVHLVMALCPTLEETKTNCFVLTNKVSSKEKCLLSRK